MTAHTPVVKPISQIQLAAGSVMTIPNINWQEFELILQELGEKPAAKIAYSNNTLRIIVPLPEHEISKDLISDIIKILLKKTGQKYQSFASTTFKKEGVAGVEPDASFYIQNYQKIIGIRRLQSDDPPPDLAIEIELTSKTTIDAYEGLAVPEVWIYDDGKLTIYLLRNRKYFLSNISAIFPEIPITKIVPNIVERAWVVGSFQALEELENMMITGDFE
ncbi:MAG: Uma2 family endonuclease [Okeania sp. SIO3B3]|nr:Uma2 family endonuclease [Okeania sp. SIO3B3]